MYMQPPLDELMRLGDGSQDEPLDMLPYGDGPESAGDTRGNGWGGPKPYEELGAYCNPTTDLGIWFEYHGDLQASVMTAALTSLIRKPR